MVSTIFPEFVLEQIKNKMRHDDIFILSFLESQGAVTPHKSFSKERIINSIECLTEARTSTAIIRLEMCCFIERSGFTKPHTFYITENGKEVLKFFN